MNEFAVTPAEQRQRAFLEASTRRGGTFSIVEKDFWVCWTLSQLFSLPNGKSTFLFKGGTSLSKVFGLIERFSEDIDIGLDRAALGFESDHHEWEGLSSKKRKAEIDRLKQEADKYVTGPLVSQLGAQIESILGPAAPAENWQQDGNAWSLIAQPDTAGSRALFFQYPQLPLPNAPGQLYIQRRIMIEIGARAAHWPVIDGEIQPYVAEVFPSLIRAPKVSVPTLSIQRTFWEKATILHSLYCQVQAGKPAAELLGRQHFSRHYYDLFCLARSPEGARAAQDHAMLQDVASFKKLFFSSPKSSYDEAKPGTLRLVPAGELEARLREDYEQMKAEMFFGPAPEWPEILEALTHLESQINAAA